MPNIFKALIWDMLVRGAISKLVLKVPLLGWGPIGIILNHFVFKFTDIMYEAANDYVELEKIFIKNKAIESKFSEASFSLKSISLRYGQDSEEFKNARNKFKTELAIIARINL